MLRPSETEVIKALLGKDLKFEYWSSWIFEVVCMRIFSQSKLLFFKIVEERKTMHDCHFRLNSICTEPLSKRKNNLINNLLFLNL